MSASFKMGIAVGVTAFVAGVLVGAYLIPPEDDNGPRCNWPHECGENTALMRLNEIEAWADEDLARRWIAPNVYKLVKPDVNRCKDPDLRWTNDFERHVCELPEYCAKFQKVYDKAKLAHEAPTPEEGRATWALCANDLDQFPTDRGEE